MTNKIKSKWCIQCGQPVDLRKKESMSLSKEFKKDIPNKEYRFVCHKCSDKFKEGMRLR